MDGVGQVGDDLDGLAEVVSLALRGGREDRYQLGMSSFTYHLSAWTHLPFDHVAVDLSGGNVVVLAQRDVQVPLIVAEIQIGLPTIVEDVDLAVLGRSHRTGVNVHVRIDLDGGYAETGGLEKETG